MSTPSGAGFTPEQMALAKQLRETYRSSGTLHLQAGSKVPPASRVTSGSNTAYARAPAPASRPSGPSAKPQDDAKPPVPSGLSAAPHVGIIRALPASSGRSNSGLVRPLSEQATSPNLSVARTSAMPTVKVMPTVTLSHPQTTSTTTVPTSSAPPVGSPAPAVRKFMPPHLLVRAAAVAAASTAPRPSAPAVKQGNGTTTVKPNEEAPAPKKNLRPVVQSHREEPTAQVTSGQNAAVSSEKQTLKLTTSQAAATTQSDMHPVRPLNAPDVVREAININKLGKPVKWNWLTEDPEVREASAEELKMSEPRPDVDPFVKYRTRRALMKAPGVVGNADRMDIDSPRAEPPRKVLGLKASRHA